MRWSPIVALSLGNVVLAQNDNTTSTITTSSTSLTSTDSESFSSTASSTESSSSATTTPGPNGFPTVVGDFQFYGCAHSGDGFPTFERVATSSVMDLEFCEANCPSSRFFGVVDTDCYCGEDINEQLIEVVPDSECNVICPGDDNEFCGGRLGLPPVAKRQNVPIQVNLSLYIRISGDDGTTVTEPASTVTTTYTTTTTGFVTVCPGDYPDCYPGKPTTYVTEIVDVYCPEPTPDYSHKKNTIICYGDYCAPQYPCEEEVCKKERVICYGEECYVEECEEEEYYKLVYCEGEEECQYSQCYGEECRKKVVCYEGNCVKSECYGNECEKNFVYKENEYVFEECFDEVCYEKGIYENGKYCPAPPCQGAQCPPPPPPKTPYPPPPPPTGPPAHGPGYNNNNNNNNNAAPYPPPTNQKTPCYGAECEVSQQKAAPVPSPCNGYQCPGTAQPTGGFVPNNNKPVVPVSDAGKKLPAFVVGIVAGLAFFL